MSNFFNKEEEKGEDEPQKVKIGDQEFTQEEAAELLNKGRLAKEIEEKQNTDLSKVYPEYTKSRQELKEMESIKEEWQQLKKEKEEAATKASQVDQTEDSGAVNPQQIKKVLQEAGFVTTDNFFDMAARYNSAQRMIDQGKEIESKGNPFGEKELPKFKSQEIFDYMSETGIKDPVTAYKVKYEEEIDEWRNKKLGESKPESPPEVRPSTGDKRPTPPSIDRSNLKSNIQAIFDAAQE